MGSDLPTPINPTVWEMGGLTPGPELNTEMLMFADVGLEKRKLLHREGSETNLRDRSYDLYSLECKLRK